MIKVLIVDDSLTIRQMMRKVLEQESAIQIVAEAENGVEAVRKNREYQPDLITMDIVMPKMNGLEATEQIMSDRPVPIVMVSSITDSEEKQISFRAMSAGAVWVISKPKQNQLSDLNAWGSYLCHMIKSMSEVKVVQRRRSRLERLIDLPDTLTKSSPRCIAIAASTGGPAALKNILDPLPGDYPLPIFICQHITCGFVDGLVRWLSAELDVPVRMARDGEPIQTGITVAPDDGHLEITFRSRIRITSPTNDHEHIPSADRLFRSVAHVYGPDALGIILTGMGADGSEGIGDLFQTGAVTIGQNEISSVVYGMPRVAQMKGYISREMDPSEISAYLLQLPTMAGTERMDGPNGRRSKDNYSYNTDT
ncbi:chemotaxis-specific protein-glutamate methyltransferase CheB [bacterium]|nr:chemotaxis-specific protein-glutamate methyltransferase CheB [bacterium]